MNVLNTSNQMMVGIYKHESKQHFWKIYAIIQRSGNKDKFIKNIEQVFCACGTGVPFGQANVQEWLSCSKSKATNVMNAMKAAKVINKVTGFGSGRYEFIEL